MKQALFNESATGRNKFRYLLPALAVTGAFGLLISFTSQPATVAEQDTETDSLQILNVSVPEPVVRDFDAIKQEGVIRMITRFNSSSYFLHRGEERGFEFEFARRFAEQHNLRLEVVIAGNNEEPIDLLNAGRGDFIAANYSITQARQQYIAFSSPYNIVEQVLVLREGEPVPYSLSELEGAVISVRRGSSYFKTLKQLQRDYGYGFEINVLPEMWDTEAIMFAIADGEFDMTIADANLFQAASNYISGITTGPVVSGNEQIAWGVRANASELTDQMDRFIAGHFSISDADLMPRRSSFMNILRQRYFDNRPATYTVRSYNSHRVTGYEGLFSPYDRLVQPLAEEYGVDWKLVLAVMAQESRFDPYAKSRMGAIGLMQIIPRFSPYEEHELWDPETNIREGLRYLRKHLDHYSYMDDDRQLAFALATYNAGMGHMADARRLTVDRNRDPNNWDDVAQSLLLLMQPRFFSQARFGFVRGTEPVNYVTEIKRRYNMYQNMALFASEDPILQRRDSLSFIP
ncbi:MAG: transporter substrate-binding domain-containing protein [Balneolales bacterium]|nr:transporter substrate-binding domain-containing protein [Balneolales bacterium]